MNEPPVTPTAELCKLVEIWMLAQIPLPHGPVEFAAAKAVTQTLTLLVPAVLRQTVRRTKQIRENTPEPPILTDANSTDPLKPEPKPNDRP